MSDIQMESPEGQTGELKKGGNLQRRRSVRRGFAILNQKKSTQTATTSDVRAAQKANEKPDENPEQQNENNDDKSKQKNKKDRAKSKERAPRDKRKEVRNFFEDCDFNYINDDSLESTKPEDDATATTPTPTENEASQEIDSQAQTSLPPPAQEPTPVTETSEEKPNKLERKASKKQKNRKHSKVNHTVLTDFLAQINSDEIESQQSTSTPPDEPKTDLQVQSLVEVNQEEDAPTIEPVPQNPEEPIPEPIVLNKHPQLKRKSASDQQSMRVTQMNPNEDYNTMYRSAVSQYSSVVVNKQVNDENTETLTKTIGGSIYSMTETTFTKLTCENVAKCSIPKPSVLEVSESYNTLFGKADAEIDKSKPIHSDFVFDLHKIREEHDDGSPAKKIKNIKETISRKFSMKPDSKGQKQRKNSKGRQSKN